MATESRTTLTLIAWAMTRDPVDVANEVEVLLQFCQKNDRGWLERSQEDIDLLAADPATSFWMGEALRLVAGNLVDRHGEACAIAWCNTLLCLVGHCKVPKVAKKRKT